MSVINKQRIQKEICEALGIDVTKAQTVEIKLSAAQNSYPVIEVKYFLDNEATGKLCEVLKKYTFAERET